MHNDPGARFTALIARSVRHVSSNETLLASAHQHTLLQIVAVVDRAFAFEHIGNGLDDLVIMRLGDRAGRHR
jgi:hypothetical protein